LFSSVGNIIVNADMKYYIHASHDKCIYHLVLMGIICS